MAASSVFISTTVTGLTTNTLSSSQFRYRNAATNTLSVKCMSSSQPPQPADEASKPSAATPTPSPLNTPPPPPPAPKVSTKFSDLFAFGGPAPERINGRLAMIGFVSAMAVELSNGQDVLTQISNGGVALFVGTSVLFTMASLVPLFKGVRAESKSSGVMTSDAEMWNGRAAMLGLVALAITEYVKGSALV